MGNSDSKDRSMQEADDGQNNRNPAPASIATLIRTNGRITHPPPDIKTIVDKTASFVAKNGAEFEKQIIVRFAGNPKYNFLEVSDPYHAYYQRRLTKFRANIQALGQQGSRPCDAPDSESTLTAVPADGSDGTPSPSNTRYPTVTLPPSPDIDMMVTPLRPTPQPMQVDYGQHQHYMMNRPLLPMGKSMPVNLPSIPVPPPSGSQFTPLAPHLFMPQYGVPGMLPPEEAPTPLPEEPKPKKQKLDDSLLVPEDQFLAQHPGPARIRVLVVEGNLKGQTLEISVESLSESVGSLKEKIAGEIQLPANKQKLSGKAGFYNDNSSLAYYNVGGGEMLSLSVREGGGRQNKCTWVGMANWDSQDGSTQEADDGQNNRNLAAAVASIATLIRTNGRITHPPPDIKIIIDKTASFVAKNGAEFEKQIIVRFAGNPKYNFLEVSDPYHAYYQRRLTEFCANIQVLEAKC